MKYDVYAIGNALLDIQAQVSDSMLYELDVKKGIMTLVDDENQKKVLTALGETPLNHCAGGSAANTGIGIAQFGGSVAFAGKAGNDKWGTAYIEDMRQLGIDVDVVPAEGDNGTCVVLITEDAQRTMLTNLSVSTTLGPEDISEEQIRQSKYVYIEGYLFTGDSTKAAAYKAIELAQKHGVPISFTVSDPFLISLFRDEFLQLIEGPVDLLFCNLEEARSLTQKHDPIDCAQWIHQHAKNVALTLGDEGSLLMHEGEAIPIESVEIKAIDSTGAGDMYAAGILYGITNGLSWKQAGQLASYAAGRVVSQMGARLTKPMDDDQLRELVG